MAKFGTNTKIDYKKGISSQKAIKIDGNLWDELDLWINKSEAQKLGFHSKADFATQAIRELLRRYSKERKTYQKLLRTYHKHSNYLKNKKIDDPTSFVDYIDKLLGSKP